MKRATRSTSNNGSRVTKAPVISSPPQKVVLKMSKSPKKGSDNGKVSAKKQSPLKPATPTKSKPKSPKKRAEKKNGNKAAKPPFPLHRIASEKTNVSEGMHSIVNLLRGKKNIMVLAGAGISVSCGIPDFRSKGSGLYSTLDHEDLGLSCPEELFDWEIFQEDPRPFFKFARNLYFPLGSGENAERVRPSDSHKLLALLEQKKMLLRVYSQNIDGLEEVAGVSPKRMVYAHGSLQHATCCKCRRKVTAQEIEPAILKRTVPLCQHPLPERSSSSGSIDTNNSITRQTGSVQPMRSKKRPRQIPDDFIPVQEAGKPPTCNGVLKPGVTFFGEALHDTVRKSLESDRNKVDALIVIGTSLSVAPMSKVIEYLPANIPRILINRNIVHPKASNVDRDSGSEDDNEKEFRSDYIFDAYLLGFCDDITRVLAKKLFSDSEEQGSNQTHCQSLASLREPKPKRKEEGDDVTDAEPEAFKVDDWKFCKLPDERVVLFHGAEPSKGNGYGDDGDGDDDEKSEVIFREVAHCDGCTKRIGGTIQKCVDCFDYDLCQKCFPKLSKSHYNGEHMFAAEPVADK